MVGTSYTSIGRMKTGDGRNGPYETVGVVPALIMPPTRLVIIISACVSAGHAAQRAPPDIVGLAAVNPELTISIVVSSTKPYGTRAKPFCWNY